MLSNLKIAFVLCFLVVISEFNGLGMVNSQTPGSKGIKGNAIKFLFQQIQSYKFLTGSSKDSLTVVQTVPVPY